MTFQDGRLFLSNFSTLRNFVMSVLPVTKRMQNIHGWVQYKESQGCYVTVDENQCYKKGVGKYRPQIEAEEYCGISKGT